MESPSAMKIMGIMSVGEKMVWNGKPWNIYQDICHLPAET
jgi:hypothetical protein